ncbi:glycosyltransferase family 4 protein [Marinobacter oulmenensis]|uniref:Glycosyltransferase involved in cell wall biosynthesis n=1 Tax=Marinobacter oulmenensis TaxID=643747 RepID=A0A840UIU3_9GAMM|nr:glycosyltransferase family 4 protein [Marinobacter oulmenensis]MBB5322235.1 glycosyltransferase involved in cell wall biosynthesis [Marinobacter oulmenensis]
MRVLQTLPALNSGGVERGTVEFARELVRHGHESIVLSSGGRLVPQLEAEGSRHISRPVHRKSLASFGQIRPVRRLLRELKPDVVHVRSRMPAWILWLAWRGLPENERPALVSTFHGMYSVNAYSAIMARPRHLIAISRCVERYILDNYRVAPDRITVIQRGVDTRAFSPEPPDQDWVEALYSEYPELQGRKLVLMPGRLTRWKGQEAFLDMMADLSRRDPAVHGVVVGGAEKNKKSYLAELEEKTASLGLDQHITFAGHRSDIVQFYRLADVVCHMSSKPEPFGRTLTEALAVGTPVVAFDRGGAAESLSACFPEGLVPADDLSAFAGRVHHLLDQQPQIEVHPEFRLDHQVQATLDVYQRALAGAGRP